MVLSCAHTPFFAIECQQYNKNIRKLPLRMIKRHSSSQLLIDRYSLYILWKGMTAKKCDKNENAINKHLDYMTFIIGPQ